MIALWPVLDLGAVASRMAASPRGCLLYTSKYGLWETIETRAFPGSVSNHHLGTQLGLLMAAYEMNQFKDQYQNCLLYTSRCV